MLTAWWPGVLSIPGAVLALVTLCSSIATLGALWTFWRRGGATEALRLANETRQQLEKLVEAQHETNVDIDRRLRESTHERDRLQQQVERQAIKIDNLEGARLLQDGRLERLSRRFALALAHIRDLTQLLIDHGHQPPPLPPDLADDKRPPTP